jgi:hypothetical protein
MGPIGFPETSVQNYHSTLRDIAPLAKYLSLTASLIKAGIASRYFVSFLWIMGPIFWSKISNSLLVILTKFLNLEASYIFN